MKKLYKRFLILCGIIIIFSILIAIIILIYYPKNKPLSLNGKNQYLEKIQN